MRRRHGVYYAYWRFRDGWEPLLWRGSGWDLRSLSQEVEKQRGLLRRSPMEEVSCWGWNMGGRCWHVVPLPSSLFTAWCWTFLLIIKIMNNMKSTSFLNMCMFLVKVLPNWVLRECLHSLILHLNEMCMDIVFLRFCCFDVFLRKMIAWYLVDLFLT